MASRRERSTPAPILGQIADAMAAREQQHKQGDSLHQLHDELSALNSQLKASQQAVARVSSANTHLKQQLGLQPPRPPSPAVDAAAGGRRGSPLRAPGAADQLARQQRPASVVTTPAPDQGQGARSRPVSAAPSPWAGGMPAREPVTPTTLAAAATDAVAIMRGGGPANRKVYGKKVMLVAMAHLQSERSRCVGLPCRRPALMAVAPAPRCRPQPPTTETSSTRRSRQRYSLAAARGVTRGPMRPSPACLTPCAPRRRRPAHRRLQAQLDGMVDSHRQLLEQLNRLQADNQQLLRQQQSLFDPAPGSPSEWVGLGTRPGGGGGGGPAGGGGGGVLKVKQPLCPCKR